MEQREEKKQVLVEALEGAPTVFLHLDARRAGVKVPDHHRSNPQLILRVGYMLTPPINIHLGEEAVTCTLSFNRSPFSCELPWDAIYAIVGDDGRAAVWPDDIPPEAAKLKEAVRAPTPLAAVPSEGAPAPALAPAAGPQKRPAAITPKNTKRPAPRKGPTPLGGLGGQPPGVRERTVSVARPGGNAATTLTDDTSSSGDEGQPETPAPTGERKPKRELPPYLRVIK